MIWRALALIGLTLGAIGTARAADCTRPNALGTSRVMTIDPREFPRLGTMQYARSLPLEDGEVVLTFDDGPMPPYTNRVLDILAEHCVKANYFIIGRMARGYPDILRRIQAEGHTIGTHSQNHMLAFDRMPLQAVQREIEDGIASVDAALGNRAAVAPFFRIPGLLRAPHVDSYLQSRGLVTWSADLAGDDWKHISASDVVRRVMGRLAEKGKGIVLLHDIQPATALALPELLRELKARGYRIVQVVPARSGDELKVATARAPAPVTATAVPVTAVPVPARQPAPLTRQVPAEPARKAQAREETVRQVPEPARAEPNVATPSPVPRAAIAAAPPPVQAAPADEASAAPTDEASNAEADQPPAQAAAAEDANASSAAALPAEPPVANDEPASASATVATPVEPAAAPDAPPESEKATAQASAAAPARPPALMPQPTDPQAALRDAASDALAASRAQTLRPVAAPVRPYTPGFKPARSFPTPGKVSVVPLSPHVNVTLERAGGVGVSTLVRTPRDTSGRFQAR